MDSSLREYTWKFFTNAISFRITANLFRSSREKRDVKNIDTLFFNSYIGYSQTGFNKPFFMKLIFFRWYSGNLLK